MLNKDMCACSEAVGNVNPAMMRMDRWSMKLLHGRLGVLYILYEVRSMSEEYALKD